MQPVRKAVLPAAGLKVNPPFSPGPPAAGQASAVHSWYTPVEVITGGAGAVESTLK